MYQSDWIMRQIEMMGRAFRRLLDALREHRPEEALEAWYEAVGELLEADPIITEGLTGEGLVTLLSAGGALDVYRAHMLGELLVARAAAFEECGETSRAEVERVRARMLLAAALPLAEGADADRIAEVLSWLDGAWPTRLPRGGGKP